jgi:hypothetical protein
MQLRVSPALHGGALLFSELELHATNGKLATNAASIQRTMASSVAQRDAEPNSHR